MDSTILIKNNIYMNMKLKINNNEYPLELMEDPSDIQNGMMGRDVLNGCMGFKLKKGFHSFHMKNCIIPLDIVFVLNNRINKIFKNCEPCKDEICKKYTAVADMVYEFPSGESSNFKEGDFVNLYLGTKNNPI